MTRTHAIGDLVRCLPGHPDQRIHEIVSIEHNKARPYRPRTATDYGDCGCDAYTSYCAVPITAYPENGKWMTGDGFVPVDHLTDAQQSYLGAKLALRASAA